MVNKTKSYVLIGTPITHSLSPIIHNAWFNHYSINASYSLLDTPLEKLEHHLDILKNNSCGFNVTAPLKEKVLLYLDEISPEAKQIKSINTVKVQNGKLIGYNTDVYGLLQTIPNAKSSDGKAVVLGSGGASKAVIYALNLLGYKNIVVVARSIEKLEELKKDFVYIKTSLWHSLNMVKADICINATSSLLKKSEIPFEIFSDYVIDLHYNIKDQSSFLKQSSAKFKKDGFEMLLYQAKKAFEIWEDIDVCVDIAKEKIDREFKEDENCCY